MTHHRDNLWGDAIGSTYGATIEQRLREAEGWQAELEALRDDDPASVRRARLIGVAACLASITGAAATLLWLGALAWKAWISKIIDAVAFFLLIAVWVIAYAVLNPAEAATGEVRASAFSLFTAVGLAAVTSALVIAYAIVTKPKVRG
jgi:hypothetical protein